MSINSVDLLSEIKLPNHLIKLNTKIGNNGLNEVKNIPIELFLNNKRVGQVVSQFNPNKYKDFMFQVFPDQTGIINGKIVIPDDDFSLDNSRNFDLVIPSQIAINIIGNSEEELLLLDLVLNAITGNTGLLQVEKQLTSNIDRIFLNNIDIILIHDSPILSSAAIEDLQRFLMRGGGLIWFTGGNHDSPANDRCIGLAFCIQATGFRSRPRRAECTAHRYRWNDFEPERRSPNCW